LIHHAIIAILWKEIDRMAQKNNSEVESEELNDLSTDNPLSDPKTDRLGYATFARHLAVVAK